VSDFIFDRASFPRSESLEAALTEMLTCAVADRRARFVAWLKSK
jgi:hypothetical protein